MKYFLGPNCLVLAVFSSLAVFVATIIWVSYCISPYFFKKWKAENERIVLMLGSKANRIVDRMGEMSKHGGNSKLFQN